MHSIISVDNWSFARYQREQYQVAIFLGADEESVKNDQYLYYVTLLENEDSELYQISFHSLIEAINYANHKYYDWKFVNLLEKSSDSGCSSCQAH